MWTEPLVRLGKNTPQAMKARETDNTIKDLFRAAISYLLLSSSDNCGFYALSFRIVCSFGAMRRFATFSTLLSLLSFFTWLSNRRTRRGKMASQRNFINIFNKLWIAFYSCIEWCQWPIFESC
jgi:hypothetical protein